MHFAHIQTPAVSEWWRYLRACAYVCTHLCHSTLHHPIQTPLRLFTCASISLHIKYCISSHLMMAETQSPALIILSIHSYCWVIQAAPASIFDWNSPNHLWFTSIPSTASHHGLLPVSSCHSWPCVLPVALTGNLPPANQAPALPSLHL